MALATQHTPSPSRLPPLPTLRKTLPASPSILTSWLEPSRGALQPPLDAPALPADAQAQHGAALAASHEARCVDGDFGAPIIMRLRRNAQALREAVHLLERLRQPGAPITPAAQWLGDNIALVEEQLLEATEALPARYFRRLPVLAGGAANASPRVHDIAWAWLPRVHHAFDATLLDAFFDGYQDQVEPTWGEWWALPSVLRMVLIEQLRRVGERVVADRSSRSLANWVASETGEADLPQIAATLDALARRGAERAFLLQLHLRWGELATDDPRRAWLAAYLPDPAAVRHAQQAAEAAHDADVSQAMRSLRAVAQFDWRAWIGQRSRLAQVLRQLPTFAAESETTQNRTLHAVERWSRRSGIDEVRVARALLAQTQTATAATPVRATPGHWLEGAGRVTLAEALGIAAPRDIITSDAWRRARLPLYLTSLAAATAAIAALTLHAGAPLWLWPLVLLPASEIAVSAIHRLIAEWIAPRALPRLAFDAGITAAHRVLVAVPCLIDDDTEIDALAARILRQHLASHEAWAQYALLSDFADAPLQTMPDDAALLAHAETAMRALNAQHAPLPDGAPRFVLLHRKRQWSDSERCWMGWERKRGKVEQLIACLAGEPGNVFIATPALPAAPTPYLVVLDSDTLLPPGTLRALVGIAAHPANMPRVDGQLRRVVEGYGVLQPRVALPMPRPGTATWFHALSAGQPGLDPYSAASSEVYQDLFEEGSFAGKGLIHVPAAQAVLAGRLPSGQVLSHDLLEGALLRCAAASDVPVLEGAPVHPDVASSRLHRWVRGDWQLLPFMVSPRRWSLSGLNLWKMIDNVRRSLVAPAAVGLLLASAVTATPKPAAALLMVIAALGIGPLIGALATLAGADDRVALAPLMRHVGHALGQALASTAWQLAQLLQQALLTVDAIVRALVRQLITRRRLLAWTTAAAAEAAASRDAATLWRRHRKVSALALLLAAALSFAAPAALLPGLLLCALWALSPLLTWRAAQTLPAVQEPPLTADVTADLHGMARETWRYFEHMVTAAHHHLPPDNHQRLPHGQTAARTSPTNIGMYLLAVLCARRFGFIGRNEMLQRIGATLHTLQTLPRHRGHFFNWYDTQSLAVLAPAYLSTVDSGNLSAALVAVAGALRDFDTPEGDAACDEAAQATLLRSQMQLAAARRAGVLALAEPLLSDIDEVQRRLAALDHEATLDGEPPQAAEQALWLLLDHLRTVRSLTQDDEPPPEQASALAAQAEQLAWAADYRWLYDPRRELLHIGALLDATTGSEQLDINHYDMLCSEARLASLVAIAKGDLPARHWAKLKRPTFAQGPDVGMQSWSGSMFEYLMPTLLVDEPAGSLLHAATQVAVAMQREQGREWNLPWGISECAHAERDASLAYQYGPQGAPALALRRTPEDERVIAPYASMLALQVAPWQAWHNLRRLQQRGARDRFGFIEALDHTASRQQSGTTQRRIATFMAHHQGMSLLALTNTLHDGAARRWFMGHPQVSAVSTLLHEPVPAMVRPLRPPPLWMEAALDEHTDTPPLPARALQPGTRALEPVAMLSNGRMSVLLRPDGAGATRWAGLAVSRWRDDALRGEHGSFMFLRVAGRNEAGARWHSVTQHPAPDPRAEYRCEWQPHAATFESIGAAVSSRLRVWVAPQEDVEVRELTLEHTGVGPPPVVELASYFELVLATQAADEAHPAFSNLFVQTRWDADLRALWFTRKGRLEGEPTVHAVHFLAESEADIVETHACTDRALALGRGRSVQSPCFERQTKPADSGLDPIASIAVRCVLPARGAAKLRFATAVSHDPAELAEIVERHRQRVHVERAWRMASALALIALREARIDAPAWHSWQLLSTPLAQLLARPLQIVKAAPAIDRRCLWHLGISGERALLLVRVPDADGLPLADWVARVTPLWARAGLSVDVVLQDTETASYLQPVHQGLMRLLHTHGEAATQPAHSACRLHVLRSQDLTTAQQEALRALARVDLLADGRAPGAVIYDLRRWHATALQQKQEHLANDVRWAPPSATPAAAVAVDLPTFDRDHGGCRFAVSATQRPQRAWANVLANPEFGCHVTEGGGGHCWAHNSRLLQLTPPSNDPLTDPAAEWLLLHDLDSDQVWNAWPAPWGAAAVRYTVEHGPGWTRVSHVHDGIDVVLEVCVDATTRIKQTHVKLRTATRTARRLRVIAVASWQIGARWADRMSIASAPAWSSASRADDDVTVARTALALLATQTDAGTGFADSTAFLALRPRRAQPAWAFDWTCDRREVFDERGRGVVPEAFCQRSGTGLDPCAALSIEIDLAPSTVEDVTLLLGHADSKSAAQALAEQACAVDPALRSERARGAWRERLGSVQVRTPDARFDALVNHWLRYQTLACRLWARAGFYQIGGAYGFRDQLQDAMALTALDPQLLRAQILLCCSRQFREGDVQHWWHPPEGAGVRTRFSDDLLWLVAGVLRHLDTGGDAALLDAQSPFIEGRPVPEGAEDVYEIPQASADTESVFEHAARALDRSLAFGVHGLPLMGAGDWNDGMNRVGIEGKGESVWLAWFQVSMLEPMAALAEQRGEAERAAHWRAARTSLLHAIETHGWDGAWYRRAFFDDGSPLGSAANAECKIDLIAQAWAVLAGGGDASRARRALQSAAEHLIDGDAGLVRLLDPPLTTQHPSAGYIQAYPRGVRENGGQYTHAAAWASMAFAQSGDAARAWQAWQAASPAHRMNDARQFAAYRLEPYAVAGDVYGHAPWRGQGGWSWYTGAAGWLLRAGVESLLGVQRRAALVRFAPMLPPDWPGAQVMLRHRSHEHVFDLVRAGQETSADERTLAVGAWLDLDALHENTHWTVPLPPQMSLRPTAAAASGPHHAYPSVGSTVSSPQEQAT